MFDRRSLLKMTALAGFAPFGRSVQAAETTASVIHTDAEWQALLSRQAYIVLRHEGTEHAGSSPLDHETAQGMYACAGCQLPVFLSSTKYDSHTGWPSFWAPIPDAVGERLDSSFGVRRTEVHCSRCAGHLGHVFTDGPQPTGLRYCMNGIALGFTPAADAG